MAEKKTTASKRLTQKEIARLLGLTQATVSMALRDDPALPAATRKRVQTEAARLGYTPDPWLTRLAAYRYQTRPAEFRATLAWLSNDRAGESWKDSAAFRDYHAGATERARQLGYLVEDHALRAPRMTPARMASILVSRGIEGLLVAPQPAPDMRMEDFSFDRFSSVTFGYTLTAPQLHLVALHQFRAMETAVRRLRALGCRRIGLALASDSDERADNNWSAAFWSEQRRIGEPQRIPPLIGRPLEKPEFVAWFHCFRPDVVLTISPILHDWLQEEGTKIPDDVGFALLSVPTAAGGGSPAFAGITENPRVIGAKAVELLVDAMHRGERGAPALHVSTLIEGTWVDGQTVRPHKGLKA
ncbi:transcriptional regulator [Opitutaceae bacterium TAV1]|nr:transcriptional regulator [Opitutaceae bacterium TAV1]